MIGVNDYIGYMRQKGDSLGDLRKRNADKLMNYYFKGDTGYKRVYILDPDEGWKFTDARFSKHAIQSLASDEVDSYLQFRPKEHYPVGTYVFIPDDTKTTLDIDFENPLKGNVADLWLIVQRNDNKQFVRYLVLRVNYNFKWVVGYKDYRQVLTCYGSHRNANSYTSGVWNDHLVTSLDNITRSWIPDTYYLYGDKLDDYGLSDTRTITHQVRMMISNNTLHPDCYMVTKVNAMAPQGIIKLTYKEDDYNPKRDNVELGVCDYYNNEGDIVVEEPTVEPTVTSQIEYMVVNADGELEVSSEFPTLTIGNTYYYHAIFDDNTLSRQWRITLIGDYDDETRYALERLMVIRNIDDETISLRPGKSNKIKGLTYELSVSDINGNNAAAITVEVAS